MVNHVINYWLFTKNRTEICVKQVLGSFWFAMSCCILCSVVSKRIFEINILCMSSDSNVQGNLGKHKREVQFVLSAFGIRKRRFFGFFLQTTSPAKNSAGTFLLPPPHRRQLSCEFCVASQYIKPTSSERTITRIYVGKIPGKLPCKQMLQDKSGLPAQLFRHTKWHLHTAVFLNNPHQTRVTPFSYLLGESFNNCHCMSPQNVQGRERWKVSFPRQVKEFLRSLEKWHHIQYVWHQQILHKLEG